MKRKLLLAALVVVSALGFKAQAQVMLETDLTSQFNSLATSQWTGSSGQVGWAAPQVTTNSGLTVAAWESYCGDWNGGCNNTGEIMYTTVSGLTAGTYKIELYGAAAFTYNRNFGSSAFTGDPSVGGKATSDTYDPGQSIDEGTGVSLYATTSVGTYSKEIPIWYADNFNGSGLSTAELEGVVVGQDGNIRIGMSKTSTSTNWHVVQLKGVTATVDGGAVIEVLKTTANALLNNAAYVNVTGSERTNLQAAYNATPAAQTQEAYLAVISALNTAISVFENCDVAAYNGFVTEKNKALALGVDAETVNSYAPANAAGAATAVQNLMVAEYNFVTTNYAYDVKVGTWNASEGTGTMTSQHWDGTSTSSYLEQSGANWGANSWTISYDQNITLPAGNYVFKVAGRKASDAVTLMLTVKKGDDVLGSVNDFPNGDTGLGINMSGETDFTTGEGHSYANNGIGRGWQWRYVKFTLDEPATVNVAVESSATVQYSWVGFCNATVQTDNSDNVALMEALVALNDAKITANLEKNTANVGTGVFQYNEASNNSLWSAYESAKTDVDNYVFTSSSTASEVNGLVAALNEAINNYQNQSLNAPDANLRYTLTIVEDGKAWDGNAVTFIAGARTEETLGGEMGGYGIKYLAPANANLNQALKFTAIDGYANTYKVSAINVADGAERYITTGSTYEGGNNTQIRTTDDASKASWIKIQATATDGQFQLLNVSDGNKVIANNNNDDMYTAGSANFTIVEASQASITINTTAAGWGTVMFPFAMDKPNNGVKFYSVSEVNKLVLKLDEVDALEANKPYIIEGVWEETLTGRWGIAGATSYEDGLLTGVYVNTPAILDTYVLQKPKNGGAVGFYIVETEGITTVTPNHAYLDLNNIKPTDDAKARAFFFDGDATAIEAVSAIAAGEIDAIYTTAGAQVQSLQKGMNIVVLKNGQTQKVFVK